MLFLEPQCPTISGMAASTPLLQSTHEPQKSCTIPHSLGPACFGFWTAWKSHASSVLCTWPFIRLQQWAAQHLGHWPGSSARDPRGSLWIPSSPPKHLCVNRFVHEPCGRSSESGWHLAHLINSFTESLEELRGKICSNGEIQRETR